MKAGRFDAVATRRPGARVDRPMSLRQASMRSTFIEPPRRSSPPGLRGCLAGPAGRREPMSGLGRVHGPAHGLPFARVGPEECSRDRGADRATDAGNNRDGSLPGIITAGMEGAWPRVMLVSSHGVTRIGPTGKTPGRPGWADRQAHRPGSKGPSPEPGLRPECRSTPGRPGLHHLWVVVASGTDGPSMTAPRRADEIEHEEGRDNE